MEIAARPKVIVLGTMTKIPVAGIVFLTMQHLIGLKRLGFDAYYVEAHARTPSMLMERPEDDGSALAAAYIDATMRRFDLGADHWAFHALHDDGRCYGLSETALKELYREAVLIFNLHGGTIPLPEHHETGRLVYLGTDPVEHEVDVYNGVQETIEYLEPHCAFFTWGENFGNPDCRLPTSDRFPFFPTRQPVVMDLWESFQGPPADTFTTIGNWCQPWRPVTLDGEEYYWSKHLEFLKFLDLPRRSGRRFELSLSSLEDEDRRLLEDHGWTVRASLEFSKDVDQYREYLGTSRGEFTVAKDQNVRLRSGWFSDRAAGYLACGRPVITQETGFSNVLPTGEGLFGFSTMEDIEAALDRIDTDYARACRAAAQIARECFDYRVVLGEMLDRLGVPVPAGRSGASVERTGGSAGPLPFQGDLVVEPISRWPTTLPGETIRAVLQRPVAQAIRAHDPGPGFVPRASIIIVTFDGLPFTRLCLESLLSSRVSPESADFEVIVVDNGSTDGTVHYLQEVSRRDGRVRMEANGSNAGFGAATNQGVALARGRVLVLLNNDTIVPVDSIDRLVNHLADAGVGLVGAVTNRAGNEAEVEVPYRTCGGLFRFARKRHEAHAGERFDLRTAILFCAALRREVWDAVGPLDERFEIGLFEDDDYAMRVRQAGYGVMGAEDVFVHHFGQASIGRLGPTGQYGELFHANRVRWEQKWGVAWQPYSRRVRSGYPAIVERIRGVVSELVPADATVLVVTKGDEDLLDLAGRQAWHFPQGEDGAYAGHHPADGEACIAELERLRAKGADFMVLPSTSLWWLEYYTGFGDHLQTRYRTLTCQEDSCAIFDLRLHPPEGEARLASADQQEGSLAS